MAEIEVQAMNPVVGDVVPQMVVGDVPSATVIAIHGNPEAATIGALMPAPPPYGSIAEVTGGADEAPVAVVTEVATSSGAYFTAEQLEIMNGWAPPADRPNVSDGPIVLAPVVGVEPPAVPTGEVVGVEAPAVATGEVVGVLAPQMSKAADFVTVSGVPFVAPAAARSPAETHSDGWQGVKSCDECLDSVDALLLFLQTHNTRPQVGLNVEGWHEETRHRTVTRDGKQHRESYTVRVSDVSYTVDLTNFCVPVGYIQSDEYAEGKDLDGDGKIESIPEICEGYLEDENLLATLVMEKKIKDFDFGALCHYVRRHIRELGWGRRLDVGVSVNNRIVRVYKENACSSLWENMCCFVLMHLTIAPCIAFRCYRDCGGHRATGISSVFRMSNGAQDYAPLQVFDVIRPALWCKGWRNAHFAQDLLHQQLRW